MTISNKLKQTGTALSGAMTVAALAISGISYLHDKGGNLQATLNGEVLENHSHREVIICLDNPKAATSLSALYPTFSNSSSYSIRDFYLSYHVSSNSVMFEPTDYYTLYNDAPGSYSLKYKETVLPGSRSVENPIREIIVAENGGNMTFTTDVTYDGSSEPYVYELKAQYMVVSNDEGLNFEQWKHKCQEKYLSSVGNTETPVFYLTSDGHMEYAVNIGLTSNREPVSASAPMSVDKNTPQVERAPEPISSPTTKVATASTPKPRQVAKLRENHVSEDNPIKTSQNNQVRNHTLGNLIESVTQEPKVSEGRTYNNITYKIKSYQKDCSLMILELLEDTITHKQENNVHQISVSDCEHFYSAYVSFTTRLQDYALCSENTALADSVEFDGEFIRNNTCRTIGVYRVDDDGRLSMLVKPHKKKWIGKGRNRICTFYEVPQQLLTDTYAPINKPFYNVTGVVKDSLLYGAFFPLVVLASIIVLFGVTFAMDGVGELKKQLSDVWKDRFNLLKLFVLWYIGGVGLLVISMFITQLQEYYDWFHIFS